MATSGSYDVNYTRNELITEALELAGVIEVGGTATSEQLTSSARTLNMMIKFWQTQGIALWRNQEIYIFLQEDTADYTLGPTGTSPATADFTKTEIATAGDSGDLTITVDSITGISASDYIGIELDDGTLQWTGVDGAPSGSTVTIVAALTDDVSVDANVYAYTSGIQRPLFFTELRLHQDSGTEIPLHMMSRNDYKKLSTKTTSGKASQWYYNPLMTDGVLSVWPVANSVKEYLVGTARMPIADFDAAGNNPDLPQEWLLPLAYNLAVLIAPKYDADPGPDFKMMAKMFFDDALESATDYGSLIIEVE